MSPLLWRLGGLGDLVLYDAPVPGDWVMNGPLGKRHAWDARGRENQYQQGPVFASLRASGTFGPHSATRELRLWRGSRRIDYLVSIDAADGNGVFCIRFPVGLSGRVFAGIPFGAEPRENFAREPFRGEYFVQGYPNGYYATRWTDVSDGQLGFTFICPQGMHTGYAYNPAERALEYILLRVRPPAKGAWGQMHPSINGGGHHEWRCALVPHPGTWREAASFRAALEAHVPLLAFSPELGLRRAGVGAQPMGGTGLEDAASVAEVAPSNVVLSSLRLVEPGEGGKTPEWELRLYETMGRQADAVVRLACSVSRVRETNFLGEPLGEVGKIEVAGKEIRLRIPPWKIVTLRVTFSPSPSGRGPG